MNGARSLLFVPATSQSKIDRAFTSGADGVIVDLEDAVAESQKGAAREALAGIFAAPRTSAAYVRVNAVSTPHCLRDLEAVPLAAMTGIVVPKVESAEALVTVDWVLSQLETERGLPLRGVGLMALIETAKGLSELSRIAASTPRLRRLVFGAVDFASDLMTAVEEETVTSQVRFALACASRAASLERPLDAPQLALHDDARLRAAALRAHAQGFGGKLCIHPAQIAIVHEVFSPTAAEGERAARIVAAFAEAEAEGRAVLTVDGEMVDYPVVERARRVLAMTSKHPLAKGTK